jgi:hypothetical protein
MKDPEALIRTVADGLSHRIDTVAGDYNKDELPQGYDIAFLSAIIHSNSPKQNQALFIKISDALNPGGKNIRWQINLEPKSFRMPMQLKTR